MATAIVFWCGGGLFSALEAVHQYNGKRLAKLAKTNFKWVSEGTLETFLVRFRGVPVLHCHGVLVWRRAVFSTGGSTTGKGWQNWQKPIFNRVSEGTLANFLVRFRGLSVLHCHGVLVWRRAVSAPESVQREKVGKIGERLFLIGFQKGRSRVFGCDFVACPSFTAMVFWCGGWLFSAPESVQRDKRLGKGYCL